MDHQVNKCCLSIRPTKDTNNKSSFHPSIQLIHQPSIKSTKQSILHPTKQPSIYITIHPFVHLSIKPPNTPTNHPTKPLAIQSNSQPSIHPFNTPAIHPANQPCNQSTLHPSIQTSPHLFKQSFVCFLFSHPFIQSLIHPFSHPSQQLTKLFFLSVQLSEGTSRQQTLHDLMPFTTYSVRVEACTCFLCCSRGPVSELRTQASVPSQQPPPRPITVTSRSALLEWDEPLQPNGVIERCFE